MTLECTKEYVTRDTSPYRKAISSTLLIVGAQKTVARSSTADSQRENKRMPPGEAHAFQAILNGVTTGTDKITR